MQAVILAAGMGKRLKELTKDNTKCMVEVNGKTLIERLLKQLAKLDLTRIVLVVGYKAQELITYINKIPINTTIEFVHNPVYDKTNNIYSLYLAKEFLMIEDTLLFESDLIIEDTVIEKILKADYPDLALVAKYENWMDGTVVTIDEENNIVRFIPNKMFKFDEIPTYYKTVNIYKFSKSFSSNMYVPFLEAYCSALGMNEYYEQVLRVITLLDKPGIKALPLDRERWYEIDDIQDLNIAESIFADKNEALNRISSSYGGYWRYPHMLDFCYLVNPFFPNTRLMDEIKANFERLLCNYPSGLSINNLLVSKNFGVKRQYICVGNGAAELIRSLTYFLKGSFGIIKPTFEEYPNRLSDRKVINYYPSNNDFQYSVSEIISFFSVSNVSNIILINPDNPSGNYIPFDEMLTLCKWCKHKNIKLVVDESFVDFSDQGESGSLLKDDILEQFPGLIVIKSISKSYGVPGLRLGLIASTNNKLIDFIRKDVSIWNINSYAEFYLQIYEKYNNDYKQACLEFRNERIWLKHELDTISYLRVIPSQANFFLCEIVDQFSSRELVSLMLTKNNILLKDCSSKFKDNNYIRIAIRNREDNELLIYALKNLP